MDVDDQDDQDDQDDHPQVDEAKKSATKSKAQPSQIAACLLEYLAANCVLFVCLFVCLLFAPTKAPRNAKN